MLVRGSGELSPLSHQKAQDTKETSTPTVFPHLINRSCSNSGPRSNRRPLPGDQRNNTGPCPNKKPGPLKKYRYRYPFFIHAQKINKRPGSTILPVNARAQTATSWWKEESFFSVFDCWSMDWRAQPAELSPKNEITGIDH